jgi:SRSO17 transposase
LLMPSEKMRVGDRQASRLGEKKCYLVNLPAEIDLRRLTAIVMARWLCEQAHLQLKEEFGLDHFEGRSWHGLHRHALMTMIAYAFLQHCRIAKTGGKKNRWPPPQPSLPAARPPSSLSAIRSAIPILQKTDQRKATA